MRRTRLISLCCAATCAFAGSTIALAAVTAQTNAPTTPQGELHADPGAKKVLGLADIGRWNRINNAELSSDGKWMTYVYAPNEGDPTLYVRQLDGSGTCTRFLSARRRNSPTTGVRRLLREPARGLGARARWPRRPWRWRRSRSRRAASCHGRVVRAARPALRAPRARDWREVSGARRRGVQVRERLQVRRHSREQGERGIQEQRLGPRAARALQRHYAEHRQRQPLRLRRRGRSAGVHHRRRRSHRQWRLHRRPRDESFHGPQLAAADYDQLTWSPKGTGLAVLRGDKKKENTLRDNVLVVWPSVAGAAPRAVEYDPSKDAAFPKDYVVSEYAPLRWTRDGSRIYTGIKEQELERASSTDPQANVDVWHWKDVEVQSVQMVRDRAGAARDAARSAARRQRQARARRGHDDARGDADRRSARGPSAGSTARITAKSSGVGRTPISIA